jgi:hypothetical protein
MSESFRLVAGVVICGALVGCGDVGSATPGYAEPCMTPMAGAMGCPAPPSMPQDTTISDACRKIVACGILAGSYRQNSGTDCENSNICESNRRGAGGECLVTPKGASKCHYPFLDYWWCMRRLTQPSGDPCDGNTSFTSYHVQEALACIAVTPCASLGLPFAAKVSSQSTRPTMDKYTCKNNSTVWTSTTCDSGLLYYEH